MDKIENWRGSIVPCAGTGSSRKLAKTIDDDLPNISVKGYSITINNPGNVSG